jgi:hypothetical protein
MEKGSSSSVSGFRIDPVDHDFVSEKMSLKGLNSFILIKPFPGRSHHSKSPRNFPVKFHKICDSKNSIS